MSNQGPRFPYSNGDYKPGIFGSWGEAAKVVGLFLAAAVPWVIGLVQIIRWLAP